MGCNSPKYEATLIQIKEGMETCRELGIHITEMRKLTEKECLSLNKSIARCDNCLYDHHGENFNKYRNDDKKCLIECWGIK